jgi:hypothetical protein
VSLIWRRSFCSALIISILFSQSAYGHGFGQRYDLPVPLWLYLAGAGAAVALSFVVVALFIRQTAEHYSYPRFNLLDYHIGRFLMHPITIFFVQTISVGLLLLVIYTGASGTLDQNRNFAVVFVWVIWWVGLSYFSALVGNLWLVLNPWDITFHWAEWLGRTLSRGGKLALDLPYPKWLGVWPALLLFLAFAWIELSYYAPAHPPHVALMAINYSYITWLGMLIFGKEQYLQHGEAFSIVFALLARFAPTELRVVEPEVCASCPVDCRDRQGECVNCYRCFQTADNIQRQFNLRPIAAGLIRNEQVSVSLMCFVLVLLSTVTFDGFLATPLWESLKGHLKDILPLEDTSWIFLLIPSIRGHQRMIINTLGLIVFPLLFIMIYLLFCTTVAVVVGPRLSVRQVAVSFVYSLIPIALGYHLAHYLTFLLIQGQLIIPLISDPLARGWNLFGTADYRPDIGIVGARFAWFTAVTAIVLGHIIAVYGAHVIAIRVLKESRLAFRSQYPMLALMVIYTVASLWILAQPIVESSSKG